MFFDHLFAWRESSQFIPGSDNVCAIQIKVTLSDPPGWRPDTTQPQAAPGEMWRVQLSQAVSLKQVDLWIVIIFSEKRPN